LPTYKSRLRLLRQERVKDYILLEQEFIQNQERLKPQDENKEKEKKSIEELRGMPLNVANLEEIIDDDHAIVSQYSGLDYYVPMLSIVDRDMLEPNCQVLCKDRSMHVCGVLVEDQDPTVSVMKVEKAPTESYGDIGGLDEQVREMKECVELPLTNPELYEEIGINAPKGVILYGEPGTGKTLLAKAVAN
jgi:26S proteasome regulatory subunit T2